MLLSFGKMNFTSPSAFFGPGFCLNINLPARNCANMSSLISPSATVCPAYVATFVAVPLHVVPIFGNFECHESKPGREDQQDFLPHGHLPSNRVQPTTTW